MGKTPPLPDKKYTIFYADPPWKYENAIVNSKRKRRSESRASDHYPTLELEEICAIPIKPLAEKDALLYLWTTGTHMEEAIKVGQAWGFTFKTVAFVWNKNISVAGFYTMTQCEYCLVFKHGRIPKPHGDRNIRQLLETTETEFHTIKRGKHSVKPYQIRKRIEKMHPEQSKIELFAREAFPGWDNWGNEI